MLWFLIFAKKIITSKIQKEHELECIDMAQCTSGELNECNSHAICTDTDGSYTCECPDGFRGDGKNCENIDECADETHDCDPLTGICFDNLGSFFCQCFHGYKLRLSPLILVTDIDHDIGDNPIISCGVINVSPRRFVLNLDVMKMLSALK